MGVNCLKCINSGCCKLVVEVSYDEYKQLEKKGLHIHFTKHIDVFLKKFPKLESKRKFLEGNYSKNYAELNKSKNEYCILLDEKTKLCTIYDHRPKVCKDYTVNRCEKIREICID